MMFPDRLLETSLLIRIKTQVLARADHEVWKEAAHTADGPTREVGSTLVIARL